MKVNKIRPAAAHIIVPEKFRLTYRFNHIFVILVIIISFSACNNGTMRKTHAHLFHEELAEKGMAMLYPRNGTIFPPEFPAPAFEWTDSSTSSTQWHVFIADQNGKVLLQDKSYQTNWRPNAEDWQGIKNAKACQPFTFTAIASKGKFNFHPYSKIQFTVSNDSVGADIFYRAVTLPFSYAVKNVHTIEWYLGSVDGRSPRKMLDNLPVCGNCHSFSNDQPLLAMDVDYGNDKGSYVIASTLDTCNLKPENVITWSNFKRNDSEPTFGLLSQISPDGNHVLSTVKDLSIFVAIDDNLAYSQLFFPIKGIIGIYSRNTDSFTSLNGANDERFVQSNPTWSPDGKTVVFARTEAYINENAQKAGRALLNAKDVSEFTTGGKPFKYDLFKVDFNNGEGGIAQPLEGASGNGKSNYFPKFSPDGKWIVFCQAENFMLLQPDSRLYIMPSQGGTPRLMNCNMEEMNSWHSWSPNGRWLVFSSKNRGLYTQLYLTHIDENGMDSPPVLLENLSFNERAANIPEFYPFDAESFKTINNAFSETAEYYNRSAIDKMSNKFYVRAMADLNKAMQLDSNLLETYFNRMQLNMLLQQSNSYEDLADKAKAMQILNDSLQLYPNNTHYLALKISLLSSMGRTNEALNLANNSLKIHSESYPILEQLGAIYRNSKQNSKAVEVYQKLLKLKPEHSMQLHQAIVNAYLRNMQTDEALKIIRQQLKKNAENEQWLMLETRAYMQKQAFDDAVNIVTRLLNKEPDNMLFGALAAQYYFSRGEKNQYQQQVKKNIGLLMKLHHENTEDTEVIFEIANNQLSLQNFTEALRFYELILANHPGNYEALKQKALIYLSTQQWNNAIAVYDQLEANYLPEEGFCNNKAIAFIQLSNPGKALEYFNKTLAINPNNQDALFNRNKLLRDQGSR